ncbi:MAG: hypothetical protein K940chlam8_00594 [Chlamydiae bacterium]|nr:hypothetical protein [Chlamydiota bacterium]
MKYLGILKQLQFSEETGLILSGDGVNYFQSEEISVNAKL